MSDRARRRKFDEKPAERRRSASPRKETAKEESSEPLKAATPPVSDAAAAAKKKAAEAAARISAMLKSKKASSPAATTPAIPSARPAPPRPPPEDLDEHGEHVRDIEVNDLRNRYLVVKESTIEDIKAKTGADVEVRGKYYPDKNMATERDPPMFLHISSKIKTKVEAAVGMANRLINSELGPLVDERRFRKKEDFERDELGRRKWPEEKVYIDMAPVRGFHLRASVVGTGGSNVKFVQQETRTRIQIKGQGSGFLEPSTDKESDEPMHLHITGPDVAELHRAKGMLEELVESVRVKYEEYKQGGPDAYDRGSVPRDSPSTSGNGLAPPPGASNLSFMGYDNGYSASPPPPPPPGSMATGHPAPPFSYSSAPPPPPGGSSFGAYGAPPPPPPGGNYAAPPPPPPGASSEAYDPYAPSSIPRPPGT